jgi:hypothetical protein
MATRIVLFSSGEWSDYGLRGLLHVDEDEYQKAVAEYQNLVTEEDETHKEIKRRDKVGDITRLESLAMVQKIEDHPKKRYEIWDALLKTGSPVDFVEFCHV